MSVHLLFQVFCRFETFPGKIWRMDILSPVLSASHFSFRSSFLSLICPRFSPVSPMRASCLCSSTGHLLVMPLRLAAAYCQYKWLNIQLWSQTVCWRICRLSYCVTLGKLLLNSLWLLQMVVRSEETMSIYK